MKKIRIGSSCALSPSMGIGAVVETRSFIGSQSKCWEVVDKAIANKQYLIFNICTNRNDNSGHIPTDSEWKNIVNFTCKELKRRGGNRNNCKIAIDNEPMKSYKNMSKERYSQLVDIAYPIIHNFGFKSGAGCEQYTMAMAKGNMYLYILEERKAGRCRFDELFIHLQGDCENYNDCENIANIFKGLSIKYGIPLDMNECFYSDAASSNGWSILKFQIEQAERIGCPNACSVFNNLDRSQFPWNTSSWNKLCFNINGNQRSGYWGQYLDLVKAKAPVPNLPKEEGSKDGMILPSVKLGTKGYLTELVEELLEYLGYEIEKVDGSFTANDVDMLRKFQLEIKDKYPNIVIDGVCGRKGYFYLINEIEDSEVRKRYEFKLNVYGSPMG